MSRPRAQQQPFSLDEKQADPILQRRGKWVKSNPAVDDELALREEYQNLGKKPFGELIADTKLFDALQDKKSKEEYLQYLKLGQQLVDPKDPLSQQRAFQVVPELKSVPEEQFDEDLAMQEWIRLLLRDGASIGPEDHKRLLALMQPDVIIPTSPVWDLDGSFTKLAGWSGILSFGDTKIPFISGEVIFRPTSWAINTKKLNTYTMNLIPVKVALLRRVYPGCRAMDLKPSSGYKPVYRPDGYSYLPDEKGGNRVATELDKWYDEVFIKKDSVITEKQTENKFIDWWKGKTESV